MAVVKLNCPKCQHHIELDNTQGQGECPHCHEQIWLMSSIYASEGKSEQADEAATEEAADTSAEEVKDATENTEASASEVEENETEVKAEESAEEKTAVEEEATTAKETADAEETAAAEEVAPVEETAAAEEAATAKETAPAEETAAAEETAGEKSETEKSETEKSDTEEAPTIKIAEANHLQPQEEVAPIVVPEDYEEAYKFGSDLIAERKFTDAEVVYKTLLDRNPREIRSYVGMFRALTRNYDLDQPNKYYMDRLTEYFEEAQKIVTPEEERQFYSELNYVRNVLKIDEGEKKPQLRVCPKCGKEYVAWVKACPNCTSNIGRRNPFTIKVDRTWDTSAAALLCGVLGLLLDPFYIGLIPNILAIVLGIKARNKAIGSPLWARIGIILGILGFVVIAGVYRVIGLRFPISSF